MREPWERTRKDQRGLTLVELLVALVMLGVIFGGMFASTSAMARSWAVGQHRVGVQQMGRASLDWMIRRIRLAGQGYQRTWAHCLPSYGFYSPSFYSLAEASSFAFLADVRPGPGVCGPMEELEYKVLEGRLVEILRTARGTPRREFTRALTVTEEVGKVGITVTDLNFCYYDIFDQLIPGQTLSASDGQETCAGMVENERLGDIYRVKVRVRVVSGRPGELPFDIASQAVRRLEVLP